MMSFTEPTEDDEIESLIMTSEAVAPDMTFKWKPKEVKPEKLVEAEPSDEVKLEQPQEVNPFPVKEIKP